MCHPCHQITSDSEGPHSLSTLARPLPALPVHRPPADHSARPRSRAQVLPGSARPASRTRSLSRAAGPPPPASPRALTHFPPASCSGLSRRPGCPMARRPGAGRDRGGCGRWLRGARRVLPGRSREGLGFREGGRRRGQGGAGWGSKPSDWSDRGGAIYAARVRSPELSRPRRSPLLRLWAQTPETEARPGCAHASSRPLLGIPANPPLLCISQAQEKLPERSPDVRLSVTVHLQRTCASWLGNRWHDDKSLCFETIIF